MSHVIMRQAHRECLDLLMRKKGVMNENGCSLGKYLEAFGEDGLKLYAVHLADLAFAFGRVRYWEGEGPRHHDAPATREDIQKAIAFAEGGEK